MPRSTPSWRPSPRSPWPCIIWYGGGEIVRGALTFGVLVAFIQYIEKFFTPIRDLSAKYSSHAGRHGGPGTDFSLCWTRKPSGTDNRLPHFKSLSPWKRAPAGRVRGLSVMNSIATSGLPTRGTVCPEGVQPRRPAGEKIALVGETAAARPPSPGSCPVSTRSQRRSIPIDGTDIRDMPLGDLRHRIGVVLQDPYLFTGSIEYNISLGDEQQPARVRTAAAGGRSRPVHRPACQRLSGRGAGAGHQLFRRRETAHLLCPGRGLRSGDPGARRSHRQRGHRHRAADPGGAQGAHGRAAPPSSSPIVSPPSRMPTGSWSSTGGKRWRRGLTRNC